MRTDFLIPARIGAHPLLMRLIDHENEDIQEVRMVDNDTLFSHSEAPTYFGLHV